jgi:hypothetical protein
MPDHSTELPSPFFPTVTPCTVLCYSYARISQFPSFFLGRLSSCVGSERQNSTEVLNLLIEHLGTLMVREPKYLERHILLYGVRKAAETTVTPCLDSPWSVRRCSHVNSDSPYLRWD